ncbi:MAG: 50S ribosomal protein L15 [Bacteroidota bacterium]
MELHTLQPAEGAIKKRKIIGRGQGSGKGGTATRGHKGAQSRSGYKTRPNFQGGQLPLHMSAPKMAKRNTQAKYKSINLDTLEMIAEKSAKSTITADLLIAHGLFKKGEKYKILGKGSLTKQLTVNAHACSRSAREVIEKQKGEIIIEK